MNRNFVIPTLPWTTPLLLGLIMLVCMCRKDVAPETLALVGEVYTVVDQQPTPAGGQAGLMNYLQKNIRYPAQAQRDRIQEKVIVGFVVTDIGKIADVQVLQSVAGGCDEEAVRLCKGMPDWTPGQLKGKSVHVRTSLPVSFTLL